MKNCVFPEPGGQQLIFKTTIYMSEHHLSLSRTETGAGTAAHTPGQICNREDEKTCVKTMLNKGSR